MLPASKAPFPWLIVFFRKIESGFIWERGGVKKKTPTNHPHPVGGGLLKIRRLCETKQITNARGLYCKPDAKKKKTPTDQSSTQGQ